MDKAQVSIAAYRRPSRTRTAPDVQTGVGAAQRYPLDKISYRADIVTAFGSPDVTEQVETFMSTLPQYPSQPTRSIVDAVDVLAEVGPTRGRPLVDRIELEPNHRELIALFGRRLKEIRPLGTHVRILFTFAPDRTLVLLYAGDKSGEWNDWYRRAIPEAARLHRDYMAATNQR